MSQNLSSSSLNGGRPFRPGGGKKMASGSVTITMSDFQTYEMQARQMECKKWIETIINESLDRDIHAALKDGVALCKLANLLFPNIIPRINKSGSVTFKLLENINSFLVVPKRMGINENQIFIATDLWDNKNIQKVIGTINVMASIVCSKGFPVKWPLVDDPNDLALTTYTPTPQSTQSFDWDGSFINATAPNPSPSKVNLPPNRISNIFSPNGGSSSNLNNSNNNLNKSFSNSSPSSSPQRFISTSISKQPSSPINSSVQVNKAILTNPTTTTNSNGNLNQSQVKQQQPQQQETPISPRTQTTTTTTSNSNPPPINKVISTASLSSNQLNQYVNKSPPSSSTSTTTVSPVPIPIVYTIQQFEQACKEGNLEKLKEILLQVNSKIDVNSIFGNGRTALHQAVINNHIEIVRYLLENQKSHINCNISDQDGNIPLHLAVLQASLPMIELLCQNAKSDVNAVNKDGITPIMMVSVKGDEKIVDILIQNGANVNSSNNKGNTALHYATLRGNKKIVDKLLEAGSDVNAVNQDGASSLHVAAEENFPNIVESLANSGARVNHQRLDGWTPLYSAAYKGNLETAVSLLSMAAKVDTENLEGWTPLHAACAEGHLAMAELLITNYNANVNLQNFQGTTPLFHACSSGHLELVKVLIKKYNADPSLSKKGGWKPIHIACYNENDDITRFLVDETNIDLNCSNSEIKGYAPIHILISTEEPRLEIIELLLKKKIDINNKNVNGSTPLHLAVFWNHFKVLELLLKYHANLDEKNNKGRTPLNLACHYGNEEIAKYLAEKTSCDFKSLKIKNNKQKILDMEIPNSPPPPPVPTN